MGTFHQVPIDLLFGVTSPFFEFQIVQSEACMDATPLGRTLLLSPFRTGGGSLYHLYSFNARTGIVARS